MITEAVCIQQPLSGMYEEKIYDIESPWNSDKWTWILFTDDSDYWCGEFRGEYRGVAHSYVRFKGIDGNIMRITCYEFLVWGEELEICYHYKINKWEV